MKLGLVAGMLLATGTLLTLAAPLASANDIANGTQAHCYGYSMALDYDTTAYYCFGVSNKCTGEGYYDKNGNPMGCTGVPIGL